MLSFLLLQSVKMPLQNPSSCSLPPSRERLRKTLLPLSTPSGSSCAWQLTIFFYFLSGLHRSAALIAEFRGFLQRCATVFTVHITIPPDTSHQRSALSEKSPASLRCLSAYGKCSPHNNSGRIQPAHLFVSWGNVFSIAFTAATGSPFVLDKIPEINALSVFEEKMLCQQRKQCLQRPFIIYFIDLHLNLYHTFYHSFRFAQGTNKL